MIPYEREVYEIATKAYWLGIKVGIGFSSAVVIIIAICVYVIGEFT